MRGAGKSKLSTGADAGQDAALAALAFLAEEPERLQRFLNLTGLGPHNLRAAAAEPSFYAAVLDYCLADEPTLLAFAASAGLTPEAVLRARASLGPPTPPDLP